MWTIEIEIRLKDDRVSADVTPSAQTITIRKQLPGWEDIDRWERSVLRFGFGLMRRLFRHGVEAYERELLEGWVHRDAQCQVQQRGSRPITLATAFGRIALSRKRVFCRRCGVWSVPLNDALGLRPGQGRTTRAFRELVCLCGSHQPYRLARRMMQRITQDADAISVKRIERILHREGEQLRKSEEHAGQEVAQRVVREFQDRNPPAPRDGILYLCLDSTFVRSHQGRNRWREGKVGYVCSEARAPTGRQGKQRVVDPHFVSSFEKIDVFTRRVYTAAIQHDYRSYSEVIVLGDGVQWIRRTRRHCFPRAR